MKLTLHANKKLRSIFFKFFIFSFMESMSFVKWNCFTILFQSHKKSACCSSIALVNSFDPIDALCRTGSTNSFFNLSVFNLNKALYNTIVVYPNTVQMSFIPLHYSRHLQRYKIKIIILVNRIEVHSLIKNLNLSDTYEIRFICFSYIIHLSYPPNFDLVSMLSCKI